MTGRTALSATVWLVAVPLAGCGGQALSAKSRYEQAFQGALQRLQSRTRAVHVQDAQQRGLPAEAAAFDKVRQLIVRTDYELSRIRPPAEVSRAHRLFVIGLREFANGKLGRVIAAMRRNDPQAAKSSARPTPEDVPAALMMKQARDEFRAKGYRLGINGGFLP